MLNRRSFLAGLLATAAAPALPPIPGPRGISYIVFEEIPLERFGNRMLDFREATAQMAALWKVYSPG